MYRSLYIHAGINEATTIEAVYLRGHLRRDHLSVRSHDEVNVGTPSVHEAWAK